jgi:hypothetical protein
MLGAILGAVCVVGAFKVGSSRDVVPKGPRLGGAARAHRASAAADLRKWSPRWRHALALRAFGDDPRSGAGHRRGGNARLRTGAGRDREESASPEPILLARSRVA